ncbi:MAG: 4Fe-4S dicluster domain-containing protein, partial [Flavobacteriaceae bacterium]|nr:4Fe-4S dicluster domain-containing protein [Flavobacteriaceae bacterium]
MENNSKSSRRKFLDKGLKLGIITAISGIGLSKIVSKLNAKPDNNSHDKMELMTTDGTLIQVDSTEVIEVEHSSEHDVKYNVREGFPNRKFVMVVDLAKCKNALACQSACNKHHYITGENAWVKVYKMQESKDTAP